MKLFKYLWCSILAMATTVLISQPAQASSAAIASRLFGNFCRQNDVCSGLSMLIFRGFIIMVILGVVGAILQGISDLFSKK